MVMGTENTGPVEIVASAMFPQSGLWDVHGQFHVRADYANGAVMYISEEYPTGVKFIGENGWLWLAHDQPPATVSDPATRKLAGPGLDASDRSILSAGIKDDEIHLHQSPNDDHHLDWLTSIRTRKPAVAPAEVGHRSCTACLLAHTAMKLNRALHWAPQTERYINDEEANATLRRPQRRPYGTDAVLG